VSRLANPPAQSPGDRQVARVGQAYVARRRVGCRVLKRRSPSPGQRTDWIALVEVPELSIESGRLG
jgi:hypothetical protein